MKFLKGFRTYITLILVAVVGALVAVQQGCLENPEDVNKVCEVVSNAWFGQVIIGLSAVAAFFRKMAN